MTATILPFGRNRRRTPPPPPLDVDRVIAAARRRASRLSTADKRMVSAIAERRRISGHEHAALVRVADALNLSAEDRG